MIFPEFITYCKLSGYVSESRHGYADGLNTDFHTMLLQRNQVTVELIYTTKETDPCFHSAWVDTPFAYYQEPDYTTLLKTFLLHELA